MLKLIITLFCILLVPTYWKAYGFSNFLWLSDVGLFLTVAALWLDSPLLMSIAIIGILPLEILWNIDFLIQLLTGRSLLGLSDYMFESRYSLFLKSLSLFHIFLPIIWIYYLVVNGYDQRALGWFAFLLLAILVITCLTTDPKKNINWVFMPERYRWRAIALALWVCMLYVILLLPALGIHFLLITYY